MIRNSKQNWEIGQYVNVGFLKDLVVLAKVMTPADHAPDAYVLSKGNAFYSFVPHNGLVKITQAGAAEMIAEGKRVAAIIEAQETARAHAEVEAALFRAEVLAA